MICVFFSTLFIVFGILATVSELRSITNMELKGGKFRVRRKIDFSIGGGLEQVLRMEVEADVAVALRSSVHKMLAEI